jgi:acetolactate synthase-1/2/3 large subunit
MNYNSLLFKGSASPILFVKIQKPELPNTNYVFLWVIIMTISGGELLLQCLKQEGVKYIFGIVGDQLNSLIDVLARKGDQLNMEFIGTRHEAAAAHMADAFARTTGQPGVCLGTVGPGAANLIGGVYAAFADSVPLIVLTAQNQTWRIYPDHGSTQGLDQINLFKPIVKWNAVVWTLDRLPNLVQWAFRIATSGRPGPVHLDLPSNLLFGTTETPPALLPPERYRPLIGPTANPVLIGEAAKLLTEAKFPLLHAGSGVLWADATSAFVQLAEHLSAAVSTSVGARGVIPEDHPLAFIPGGAGALQAQNCADVVLLVGGRLGDLDFWGKPPGWAPPQNQKLIHLDIDSSAIGLNREIDLALVGDARSTLQFLLAEVQRRSKLHSPSPLLEQCQKTQQTWLEGFVKIAEADKKPIHPLQLIKTVRDFFDRTAISCVDGGNTVVWCSYLNRIFEPRTYLWAGDSGQLGAGLGFALGAKFAYPDRQVYLITGDGAFSFHLQELETAARYKLPIVAVIANDRRYGMIAGVQHLLFDNRFYGVDFTDVRYDKIAQAMGCFGERVQDPKELRPALNRAVKSQLPAVLDVIIDQDANLNPPDLQVIGAMWLEGCQPPPITDDEKTKKQPKEVPAS